MVQTKKLALALIPLTVVAPNAEAKEFSAIPLHTYLDCRTPEGDQWQVYLTEGSGRFGSGRKSLMNYSLTADHTNMFATLVSYTVLIAVDEGKLFFRLTSINPGWEHEGFCFPPSGSVERG